MNKEFAEYLMSLALEQARTAAAVGEVPVGAVVASGEQVLSAAHNLVETEKDASRHAEIVAMQMAASKLGDWRLNGLTLCVTLEPCSMCIAAAKLARISTLIYALEDPEKGACGSVFDLSQDGRLGFNPQVISGIRAAESAELLRTFFKKLR